MKVVFHDEAQRDVQAVYNYYESLQEKLGVEFQEEFDHAKDAIVAHPQGWQPINETHRRYRLRRFPYGIVYRIDGDLIKFIAVMHLSRDPDFWVDRDLPDNG